MDKPKKFIELIEAIKLLPGIGSKNAERLAYDILKNEYTQRDLIKAIDTIKLLNTCKSCGVITDGEICQICSHGSRDKTLCIVSTSKELFQLEDSGLYYGYYHVVGGEINIQQGITPDDLNINTINDRIEELGIEEVILALNFTIQGETTAKYISNIIKCNKISSLAKGIPLGGTVEYLDEYTLKEAFNKRIKV